MRATLSGLAAATALLSLASVRCSLPGAATPKESDQWTAGTATHVITSGGDQRSFLLHVPRSRPKNRFGITQRYPLVIVLHGSGANGEAVRNQSSMDSVADVNGWLVAYPNAVTGPFGLGADWNAGNCCGVAARDSVDDVGFIVGIVDRIAAKLPVNPNRVYVAGFSAGARMTYHVACRAATRIAAIAVLSGSVRDDHCRAARSVPLIAFHGTADDKVAYSEPSETPLPPLAAQNASTLPPSVQLWAASNKCRGLTQTKAAADVTRYAFTGCSGDVVFYSVSDGGHGWPGEPDGDGSVKPLSEVQATRLIAQFFAQHPRR